MIFRKTKHNRYKHDSKISFKAIILLLSLFSFSSIVNGETYYHYYYYYGNKLTVTKEELTASVERFDGDVYFCKIGEQFIIDQNYIGKCPEYISSWKTDRSNYFAVDLETAKDPVDYDSFYCLFSVCSPSVTDAPITDNPSVDPPDPYKGAQKCTESGTDEINYIVACGCIPAAIADISSKVYYILRLIGPVILIIIGGIEMAKAVTTQDESAIAKAKKKLVNKAVAAAMIFLVLTLIKLGISIVRSQAQVADIYKCIDYLLNGYNI